MKEINKAEINKADKWFSLYVRTRDSNALNFGECCSCLKKIPVKGNDCGHFVSRSYFSTRYLETNAHLQCANCNRFKHGNTAGYAEFMNKKYGPEYIEELNRIKNNIFHQDLEIISKEFRLKYNDLVKLRK